VILADLEVYHSGPIAPPRRVAIGRTLLPVDPAPGFGGLLLGGIVAGHIDELDPELFEDLHRLTFQLELGQRIPQPRLRHRFQTDRVGLTRSVHRLLGEGEDLDFDFEVKGAAAQHILAAVYAAGALPPVARAKALSIVRQAMRWAGPLDRSFVTYLSGLDRGRSWSAGAVSDPVRWAVLTLGLAGSGTAAFDVPDRESVQRRFREMLRDAHPDHGADTAGAADRIAELTEARRILLAR
jgi:hypothetical protein